MNLTKINGTYSKELSEHFNEIRKISFDSRQTVEDMREYVYAVIEPATIEAEAKTRFMDYLDACTSKKEIYWLCYNTIQKAMKYDPEKTA